MNGNNGKDEVSTTTPNVYDYEAENPPEKLTNPTEKKYEKQKKIFKKSRNNTKKIFKTTTKTNDRANSRGFS